MTDRMNVTVERDEFGYTAISPNHPTLSGIGRTAAASIVDLGYKMTRAAAESAESAQTPCETGVHNVDSSRSRAQPTRDAEEGPMGELRAANQSATDGEWKPGRPVPGALKWLKEHGDEYAGEWVAIGPNGLAAHGQTFEQMESQLPSLRGVLIVQLV